MPSSPPSRDRHRVASRVHSAAIHVLRRVRRVDTAIGLSAARASALSVLVFGGPRTIGELAEAEQVSAPTMTRLVTSLDRAGLARREASPRDRRRVIVRATKQGERRLHEGRERRVRELAGLLSDLPARKLAVLAEAAALLERLSTSASRP